MCDHIISIIPGSKHVGPNQSVIKERIMTVLIGSKDARNVMASLHNMHSLPKRFKVTGTIGNIRIVDTKTGKASHVSVPAYMSVRKVLKDLFEEQT
jgi:hypothetical protein